MSRCFGQSYVPIELNDLHEQTAQIALSGQADHHDLLYHPKANARNSFRFVDLCRDHHADLDVLVKALLLARNHRLSKPQQVLTAVDLHR